MLNPLALESEPARLWIERSTHSLTAEAAAVIAAAPEPIDMPDEPPVFYHPKDEGADPSRRHRVHALDVPNPDGAQQSLFDTEVARNKLLQFGVTRIEFRSRHDQRIQPSL